MKPALWLGVTSIAFHVLGGPATAQPASVVCEPGRGAPASNPDLSQLFTRFALPSLLAAGEDERMGGAVDLPDTFFLRITWMPTGGAPVVVRLEESADRVWSVTATHVLTGPGQSPRRIQRALTGPEADRLNALLTACPPSAMAQDRSSALRDGVVVFIESAGPDGRYLALRHITGPGELPALAAFGLGLSGWVGAAP